jgi:hypothetical protein
MSRRETEAGAWEGRERGGRELLRGGGWLRLKLENWPGRDPIMLVRCVSRAIFIRPICGALQISCQIGSARGTALQSGTSLNQVRPAAR